MIEATISSYAPNGKKALFAVSVTDGEKTHDRVVPTGNRSTYIAELLAIKYACEVVDNKNTKLSITTTMPFILKIFEKEDGEWLPLSGKKRDQNKNALAEEIRVLADKFDDFEIIHADTSILKNVIKKYSSI